MRPPGLESGQAHQTLANYCNPSATTCNLSVVLHVVRRLVTLPRDVDSQLVRTLAESFAAHATARDAKMAVPLIEYEWSEGKKTPTAPLLPGWDPARYQDAHECLLMLMEQIEKGLAGTEHADLVRNLFEGERVKQLCRGCGCNSAPLQEAFRCIELGGPGLQTDINELLNAYWSKRDIDSGANTVFCEKCNTHVNGCESYTLQSAPQTLLLTMSRRDDTSGHLTGNIIINETIEMGGHALELFAVFVRKGQHYYAYIRSPDGNGTLLVDDMALSWMAQHITEMEWKSKLKALAGAVNEQATALVYRRALARVDAMAAAVANGAGGLMAEMVQREQGSAQPTDQTTSTDVETEPGSSALTFRAQVQKAMSLPIERWPDHYQTAAQAPLLGYKKEKYSSGAGRHGLCLFCIHNGCPPDLFLEWIKARDCVKSDAWPEFRSTITKLSNGKSCGNAWDVREKKKVTATMPEAVRTAVPAALELISRWAKGKRGRGATAVPQGCKAYYGPGGCFPAEGVARLLHREGSPFQLREVAIDSKILRSRPVLSFEALGTTVLGVDTVSLHAGPAFDKDSQEMRLDGLLGTELVLEIDELPGGIPDAMRWTWLRHAVKVLLKLLVEWHGVKKVRAFHHTCLNQHHLLSQIGPLIHRSSSSRRATVGRTSG